MRIAIATLLLALGVAAPAQAYKLERVRWYSHTVTYYNAAPHYKQAAAAAARAWNRSGARIRFKAVSRRDARVVISIDRNLIPTGQARFSASRSGLVSQAQIRMQPDASRGWTGAAKLAIDTAVIAHEMGHVIGLDHEGRRCATMNASLWSRCNSAQVIWQTRCRTLEADDVRGAIRVYGGRLRKVGAPFCDMVSQPPPPSGLTATIGATGSAHLAWTMPVRGAESVRVLRRLGVCPSGPEDKAAELVTELPATPREALSFDDTPPAIGHYCYAVVTLAAFQRPSTLATVFYDGPTGFPPSPAFEYATDPANPLVVHFTDRSTDEDGQLVAWSWDFGDGTTSAEQHPTHAYAAAGGYRVTLTITDSGRQTRAIAEYVYTG